MYRDLTRSALAMSAWPQFEKYIVVVLTEESGISKPAILKTIPNWATGVLEFRANMSADGLRLEGGRN